jgi:hypothetical protein
MTKGAKQTAALGQLRALADRPAEQVEYALDLLAGERSVRVVPEALDVVAAAELPAARPVLLDLYEYYAADGVKRDPGCQIRSRILQALLPISVAPDGALAERALTTYEFLPPTRAESAGGLRAAGLALLAEWDPGVAVYHAVRLLTDPHTARMSGEPAVRRRACWAARANCCPSTAMCSIYPTPSPRSGRSACGTWPAPRRRCWTICWRATPPRTTSLC